MQPIKVKRGKDLKVGDVIRVWWKPNWVRIVCLEEYSGPLRHLWAAEGGARIAGFDIGPGMTIGGGTLYEVQIPEQVEESTEELAELKSDLDRLISGLRARMVEVDSDVTKSAYRGGSDIDDRPPDGDDYNLLWDAVLDEILAVRPDFTLKGES